MSTSRIEKQLKQKRGRKKVVQADLPPWLKAYTDTVLLIIVAKKKYII